MPLIPSIPCYARVNKTASALPAADARDWATHPGLREDVSGKADGGKEAVVTCTLHMAWDDRLTRYNFGPSHPLAPVRVELTVELARDFGVLDAPGVSVAAPDPAGEIGRASCRERV